MENTEFIFDHWCWLNINFDRLGCLGFCGAGWPSRSMPAKGGKSFASNPKKDKCAEKSLELFFEDLAAEVDAQPDPPDVVELDPPDAVQQDLEVGDGVAERVADEAPLE